MRLCVSCLCAWTRQALETIIFEDVDNYSFEDSI